jgi:two-component system cell cycle response regulator
MTPKKNRKVNVLIIDDDSNVLNMLELGLRDEFNIVAMFQPDKALELLKSGDFDLVITDIMMPYVSGFEILRSVKETNELIEVILLTGELPDRARPAVTFLQNGAHDYLLKPVKLSELKAAIEKALEKQQLRVENKRLMAELVHLANTDPLTRLSNRRHFYTQFYLEFERSRRYCRPLSCLVLDIDKFKQVNDRYGHRCGDWVLERIGDLMNKCSRASDLKCRYGGDEFVLVLPEADQAGAIATAEKLRQRIDQETYELPDQTFKVTASVGIAALEEGNFESGDDLIDAADLASLAAKRDGGNSTCCSGERFAPSATPIASA